VTPGYQDWHCHFDRALTCSDEFFAHKKRSVASYIRAPLVLKQDAIGDLHLGHAYSEQSLVERMSRIVEANIAAGITFLNGIADTSPDIDGRAVRAALIVKKKYKDKILVNVGGYPIFGFKTLGSDRQLHLEEMAPQVDFLLGLPERDDRNEPGNNVHFEGHLGILLDMALRHKIKHVQVHVDQTGREDERGTERLVEAVRYIFATVPKEKRPKIWAVHMISPSSYNEERFWTLVRNLKSLNIGVIICPHAALSMRQNRSLDVPMHNSIARGLELIASGLDVRLGTDNIIDILMPAPTALTVLREAGEEHATAQTAWRFYEQDVYDKLLRGERLTDVDRYNVGETLKGDYAIAGWNGQRPWLEIEKIKS
jgi:cytosine/adenosine deaminase-related metal-dependent hydrolase